MPRHHVGAIKDPLILLENHDNIIKKGLSEAFNWAPIMQTAVSLWDNRCLFFSTGSRQGDSLELLLPIKVLGRD